MRRDQLEHAIRTACQIIGQPAVIVVGSQSILGTYREEDLPAEATMSVEVDILPIADDNAETARLADLIEGVAGEFSPFEELHGFSIDGVDLETAVLPDRWLWAPVRHYRCRRAATNAITVTVVARRLSGTLSFGGIPSRKRTASKRSGDEDRTRSIIDAILGASADQVRTDGAI